MPKLNKISKQIVTFILIVSGFLTLIFTLLQSFNELHQSLNEQESRIKNSLDNLSPFLAQSLWDVDTKGLKIVLDSFKHYDDITSLSLFDDTSALVYSTVTDQDDPSLALRHALFFNDRVVGSIVVMPAIANVRKGVAYKFLSILAFNILKAILVSLALMWFLNRHFSQRVEKIRKLLAEKTKDLSIVGLVSPEFVGGRDKNELAELEKHSHLLISAVETSRVEWKKLNDSLSHTVQVQVDELMAKEKKLISSQRLVDLGLMAAGIGHEINNPLAIVAGRTDQSLKLLNKLSIDKNSEPTFLCLRGNLEAISKTSTRIAAIVKMIQQLSRETSQDPFLEESLRDLVFEIAEYGNMRVKNTVFASIFKCLRKILV